MSERQSRPLFDIILGLVVGVVGLYRVVVGSVEQPLPSLFIALGMAVAVGLFRRAPGVALALVWLTAVVQVGAGLGVAMVQLAAVVVAYGTSRYGRRLTVVLGAVSIPLGGAAALVYVSYFGYGLVRNSEPWQLLDLVAAETNFAYAGTVEGLLLGFLVITALLAGPWALGLVLRLRQQNRRATEQQQRAEAETAQAQQLAEVRTAQARLARDVHDVVGHSLAVIIAQADSTQAMADADVDRIRAAVANIGETARRSLDDVRSVLSDGADPVGPVRRAADLDALITGVRDGGTHVDLATTGSPRPLPPDLEMVAYRALQEMLTNALKHGADRTVIVELEWETDELTITTRNPIADVPGPGGRNGIDGLRDRLLAVGGGFDAAEADGVWTAHARIPVRTGGVR